MVPPIFSFFEAGPPSNQSTSGCPCVSWPLWDSLRRPLQNMATFDACPHLAKAKPTKRAEAQVPAWLRSSLSWFRAFAAMGMSLKSVFNW